MNRGFTEETSKTYATAKHRLGAIIETPDGCRYRFAKNGAVALGAGLLCQAALPIAHHAETVCDVARAIGATAISATLGATAATVDYYKDGYAVANKNAGIGYKYRIKNHLAVLSAGILTANLYEDTPVRVALVAASSELTFVPNKFSGVLVHDSPPTAGLCGVTQAAVPISYYCWLQTRGPSALLASGTLVIGDSVVPSATTDGSVMPSAAFETDGPLVGRVMVVNVTAEYAMIDLCIE